jgi:hypothetical protein
LRQFLSDPDTNYLSTNKTTSPLSEMNVKSSEIWLSFLERNNKRTKFWLKDIIGIFEIKKIIDQENQIRERFYKLFIEVD